MAKFGELKRRYDFLHRFLSGVTIVCAMITIVGSSRAGASVWTIGYRTVLVTFSLLFIERLAIRLWASWENVQYSGNRH